MAFSRKPPTVVIVRCQKRVIADREGPQGARADQGSRALLHAKSLGVATMAARGIVELESLSGGAAPRP